jgi:hypothetical protein
MKMNETNLFENLISVLHPAMKDDNRNGNLIIGRKRGYY